MNITDTFDRADNATSMGTTSDGLATWTYKGTWGIASNQARIEGGGGGSQSWAAVNAGVADGTVQVTMATVSGNFAGVAFRVTDASNYWGVGVGSLIKCVAGSVSAVGTSYTSEASGDTLAVVLSGSSITVKKNGTTVLTATDSFNSTATSHGLIHDTSTPSDTARYDNFSFTGAAAPPFHAPHILVRGRAVSRASVI